MPKGVIAPIGILFITPYGELANKRRIYFPSLFAFVEVLLPAVFVFFFGAGGDFTPLYSVGFS